MDSTIRTQLTEDLDFISACLKRIVLRQCDNPSMRVLANIGAGNESVFNYFCDNATLLNFDLRLEVSDAMILDHAKDRLRKVERAMTEVMEPTESTNMILLAHLRTTIFISAR